MGSNACRLVRSWLRRAQRYSRKLTPTATLKTTTNIDVLARLVLHQLPSDVLARLSGRGRNLAVVFPVATRRLSEESGGRGVSHPSSRH